MDRANSVYRVKSPGRVNLIGEHTDYAAGRVMPMATDLDTTLTARAAERVTVHSAAADETRTFHTDDESTTGTWIDYLKGCYAVLRAEGYDPGGFEGRLTNTLPVGSGLSSSASLELAVLWFLNVAYGLDIDRRRLASLGQRVETEFIGVSCGIMDQFAVALGKEHHTLHLDTDSMDWETVALPSDVQTIVFHTGVDRSLRDSAYNERRQTIESALQTLGVTSSQAVEEADLATLSPLERERLGYVVRENERVHAASAALEDRRLESFGDILTDAHRDIAEHYDASCPELDFVVERAVEAGAYGARLTGAGWGGAAIAVAEASEASTIAATIRRDYEDQFPEHDPETHLVTAAPGVDHEPVSDDVLERHDTP